jgi:serine/threonine-protein kinase
VLPGYAWGAAIGSGGMATVHLGQRLGAGGFSRTVAIKRLHTEVARDAETVAALRDEARIGARLSHRNLVAVLDVLAESGELCLVLEYVHGASLAQLFRAARRAGERLPLPVIAAIVHGALCGLFAAHHARDEHGGELGVVHRDVSPSNILVGTDGVARVGDFGIAKATGRLQTTRAGQLKGKVAYMAPEQLQHGTLSAATDVHAAAAVLWEGIAGRPLFDGADAGEIAARILAGEVAPPSAHAPCPAELDAVVLRGLRRRSEERFASARDMALALEAAVALARPRAVGEWVERLASDVLAARAEQLESIGVPGARGGEPARASLPGADEGSGPRTMTVVGALPPAAPDATPEGAAATGRAASAGVRHISLRAATLAAAAACTVSFAMGAWWARARAPADIQPTGAPVAADTGVHAGATPDAPLPPPLPPSAPPAAAATGAPSAQAPAPPAHAPAPAPPAHAGKRDCRSHFDIDEHGRKRLRPECL